LWLLSRHPPFPSLNPQPQPDKSSRDMSGERHGKREGACGPAGAGAAGGCCPSRATRPVGIRASISERARAPLEGARGEQGGVGSAAAGRGAGRGRRQLEVPEAEVAAGARAATAEEAATGLVPGVAAAVRRRRSRGGRTARRRRGRRPRVSAGEGGADLGGRGRLPMIEMEKSLRGILIGHMENVLN
jgi:hypothetical protein